MGSKRAILDIERGTIRFMKKTRIRIMYCIFAIVIFSITFLSSLSGNAADYGAHISSATQILTDGLWALLKHNQYPLWHICVALVTFISRMPIRYASGFVSGIFNALCYCAVCMYFNRREEHECISYTFISFLLLLIGPLCPNKYGFAILYWTPNPWHNPTHIAVRPIAVFAFVIILDILYEWQQRKTISKKNAVLLSVLLVLTNIAKPSFAQIIIPGLGLYLVVYMLTERSRDSLVLFGKMLLIFVPCFAMTILQTVCQFFTTAPAGAEENGVEIAWMDVVNQSLGGKPLILLIMVALPVIVLIISFNSSLKIDVRLSICVLLCAFLEAALLAEKGGRRYDGNFTWGFTLAEFFAFMISAKLMLNFTMSLRRENIWKWILALLGWGIFAVQVYIGVNHLWAFLYLRVGKMIRYVFH